MKSRSVRPPGPRALMSEEYLSVAQLSERVPYTPKTIRNLMWRGVFREGVHFTRLTGRPIFLWSKVEALLREGHLWAQGSESIDAPIASFLTSISGAAGSASSPSCRRPRRTSRSCKPRPRPSIGKPSSAHSTSPGTFQRGLRSGRRSPTSGRSGGRRRRTTSRRSPCTGTRRRPRSGCCPFGGSFDSTRSSRGTSTSSRRGSWPAGASSSSRTPAAGACGSTTSAIASGTRRSRRPSSRKRDLYTTRHTFATHALVAGEDPGWVARMLGHTTLQMIFTTYYRYLPNLVRRDGSLLAKRLGRTGSRGNRR